MASLALVIGYVLTVILLSYCQIHAVSNDLRNSSMVRSELSMPGSMSSTPAMTESLVGSSPPTLSTEFKRGMTNILT